MSKKFNNSFYILKELVNQKCFSEILEYIYFLEIYGNN